MDLPATSLGSARCAKRKLRAALPAPGLRMQASYLRAALGLRTAPREVPSAMFGREILAASFRHSVELGHAAVLGFKPFGGDETFTLEAVVSGVVAGAKKGLRALGPQPLLFKKALQRPRPFLR